MSTTSDDIHASPPDPSPSVPPPAAQAGRAADDGGTASLETVRDLLFGAQMRDYERRFARLEERLLEETSNLNDEVQRRLAALEELVRREAATLAERIGSEMQSRAEAVGRLSGELQDIAGASDRRSGALGEHLDRLQREFRQQLLEQAQRQTDEVRERMNEVLARLERESSMLRTDKADRGAIASLLSEMAARLTNEPSVPDLDVPRNG